MEDFIVGKTSDGEPYSMFVTRSVGIAGAQPYIKKLPDGKFEARMAVAILGGFNMKDADLERIKYNPFHADFNDNFVSGIGDTEEEAVKAMNQDASDMADSLWIE